MDTRFDELLDFPTNQTFKVMGVAHRPTQQVVAAFSNMRQAITRLT